MYPNGEIHWVPALNVPQHIEFNIPNNAYFTLVDLEAVQNGRKAEQNYSGARTLGTDGF